jgi:hypothetical protein
MKVIMSNTGTGGYQFHGRRNLHPSIKWRKAVKIFIEIIKLAAKK